MTCCAGRCHRIWDVFSSSHGTGGNSLVRKSIYALLLSFSTSQCYKQASTRFSILCVALKYRGSTGGSGISLNQLQLNRQLTGQEVDFRFSFFSVLPSAIRTKQEGREFYVHVILMRKTIDMILSH